MLDLLTITRTGCAAEMDFFTNLVITITVFVGGSLVGFVVLVTKDAVGRRREAGLHAVLSAAVRATHQGRAPSARQSQARPSGESPTGGSGMHVIGVGATTGSRTPRASGRPSRRASMLQVTAGTVAAMPASLLRMRWGPVFKTLALFWTICYPGISVKLFRVFRCIRVGDDWWLTSDMRLQCFTTQWGAYAVLAIVMLVVYTVGLPLGMALWLWRNRKGLRSPGVQDNLGFL